MNAKDEHAKDPTNDMNTLKFGTEMATAPTSATIATRMTRKTHTLQAGRKCQALGTNLLWCICIALRCQKPPVPLLAEYKMSEDASGIVLTKLERDKHGCKRLFRGVIMQSSFYAGTKQVSCVK
jgi:hypothetical protein